MVNSHDTSLNRSADSSLFNLFLLFKLLLKAALGQLDVLQPNHQGQVEGVCSRMDAPDDRVYNESETPRWTGARLTSLSTCLVRRRGDVAALGQLKCSASTLKESELR
jgi:hypothetical protein